MKVLFQTMFQLVALVWVDQLWQLEVVVEGLIKFKLEGEEWKTQEIWK